MMSETEVSFGVDVISNVFWKEQRSQWVVIKETFSLNYFIRKKIKQTT